MITVPNVTVYNHPTPDPFAAPIHDPQERKTRYKRKELSDNILRPSQPDAIQFIMTIVKAFVAVTGTTLTFMGIYSLYPIKSCFSSMSLTVMKLYCALFGLSVTLIEGKAILPDHSQVREWFYSEFHFLATPRGRGLYYLLVGTIALALSESHVIYLCCGLSMTLFALVNIIASFTMSTGPYKIVKQDFKTITQSPAYSHNKKQHGHHHHHHKIKMHGNEGTKGGTEFTQKIPPYNEVKNSFQRTSPENNHFLVDTRPYDLIDNLDNKPDVMDTKYAMASYTAPLKYELDRHNQFIP